MECSRKNAGLARRTRITLLDPHRKNPACYWELRIVSRCYEFCGVSEQTETALMMTPFRCAYYADRSMHAHNATRFHRAFMALSRIIKMLPKTRQRKRERAYRRYATRATRMAIREKIKKNRTIRFPRGCPVCRSR